MRLDIISQAKEREDVEPLFVSEVTTTRKKTREKRFEFWKKSFAEIPLANNTFSRMKKSLQFRKRFSTATPEATTTPTLRQQETTLGSKPVNQSTTTSTENIPTIAYSGNNTDIATKQQKNNYSEERKLNKIKKQATTLPEENEIPSYPKMSPAILTLSADSFEMDDRVELIPSSKPTICQQQARNVRINRATEFMRRQTNFLRRAKNLRLLKTRWSAENKTSNLYVGNSKKCTHKKDDSIHDKSYKDEYDTHQGSKNTNKITNLRRNISASVDVLSSDDNSSHRRQIRSGGKKFMWKNARRHVRYVVRLIRRESRNEDDDEALLMEENECDFTSPNIYHSPYQHRRRHSISGSPSILRKETHVDSTALNMRYLSPKGRNLNRLVAIESELTPASSRKSSRRNSLDSCVQCSTNPFQKYLNKSHSIDSTLKSTNSMCGKLNDESKNIGNHEIDNMKVSVKTTCNDEGRDVEFERSFLRQSVVLNDEDEFHCVQNFLYAEHDDDVIEDKEKLEAGSEQFEFSEDEIEKEVNSFMESHENEKKMNSKRRYSQQRGSAIFYYNKDSEEVFTTSYSPPLSPSSIKHTSAFSYSVNDLYDLFNTKDKLMTLERSFDDLVV